MFLVHLFSYPFVVAFLGKEKKELVTQRAMFTLEFDTIL